MESGGGGGRATIESAFLKSFQELMYSFANDCSSIVVLFCVAVIEINSVA